VQDYEEIKRFNESLFSFNIELVFDFTTGLLVDLVLPMNLFLSIKLWQMQSLWPCFILSRKEKRTEYFKAGT